MQLLIDIKQQDLHVLLPLLERLKITYTQLPVKADKKTATVPAKRSDKYAGKLSVGVGEALQKHISESRNEWDRNI